MSNRLDWAIEKAKDEMGVCGWVDEDEWYEVVQRAKEIIAETWQTPKEDYAEYLESDEWKAIRELVLRKHNYRCQKCDNKATLVHHENNLNAYEYVGKPMMAIAFNFYGLIPLCESCHKKIHSMRSNSVRRD